MRCMCDWPDECNGLGILHCDGCGGDLCVCRCGGEIDCGGCINCNYGESDEGPDDYDKPWGEPGGAG